MNNGCQSRFNNAQTTLAHKESPQGKCVRVLMRENKEWEGHLNVNSLRSFKTHLFHPPFIPPAPHSLYSTSPTLPLSHQPHPPFIPASPPPSSHPWSWCGWCLWLLLGRCSCWRECSVSPAPSSPRPVSVALVSSAARQSWRSPWVWVRPSPACSAAWSSPGRGPIQTCRHLNSENWSNWWWYWHDYRIQDIFNVYKTNIIICLICSSQRAALSLSSLAQFSWKWQ